ncbi:ammonia-dependent NAD(+) synthetase [Priestia megaterium]|jgi:NAD+ synthase|uniref:NH(3)-dependent NAD(+) synthetase n=1 Tax=Priestia megaterium (strain ATCC 14581 / DSM 32 / CCUG 1817 / JCM 2506 / NBRC 15308 / NCIMB 9376 / NCTC 10342 / NRRL B-14308 / VKM B-512 / Ford 19) TaxID=1348623 RepID=A0A0B6ANL5_PRIM2|nr:ammonia-dependent NAD(+) synthetase [Priestia megaterium]AJI22707.1 NH(3)-dependent NAD(+) synthetase [Priestia megaterium NBRC 15308 = ATCC 14581]KFM96804.1 NH(3)-dependent NAD(+) synthetase [Priestia megaterium]KGJ86221.1 NAD synthetase [Priestia megaterium NBRC 15308 = ATCC 14581]MDR4233293.1 ammonia-dependent NAD(+) synthetase [Priestia megaterium]MED3807199.1 ammonia-dependent NAD(+) synthetase [Priestia megaterium]
MKELQKQIIEEMHVQKEINPVEEIRRSVDFLKSYMNKYPFLRSFVLGISGGQDSTLTGKLAQLAVNELNEEAGEERYQFIAVRLPYGVQADEADCQDALAFIQPTKSISINVKPAVDAMLSAVEEAADDKVSDFNKGNVKARERMIAQYTVAGMYSGVVLGTDHSAEAVTGFYTKFGDGGADLVPIFRLNKRQGKQMLKKLGCPEHLYMKKPTADLEEDRPQLPDEEALGVTYEQIDDYLEGKDVGEHASNVIEGHFLKTQHKRQLPITVFDDFWK